MRGGLGFVYSRELVLRVLYKLGFKKGFVVSNRVIWKEYIYSFK